MAESKNHRKKKKKRTQNHRAPDLPPTREEIAQEEAAVQEQKKQLKLSIVAFVLMAAGFILAQFWSRFVGYPISFAGSILGIATARSQTRGRAVTIICYTIFAVLVAYMWCYEFLHF